MPVKKLRTLKEAEENLWRDPTDPDTWRQIDALWRLGNRFRPRFAPGVRKFRTIEEASASLTRREREPAT